MNQVDKSDEYIAFWVKFVKNAEEILKDYNNLSLENRYRVGVEAYNALILQGVNGVIEYAKKLTI